MAFDGLANFWTEHGPQLQLLAISGAAGAFFRVILAPESDTKKRIVQGIGGAISAIFLGGYIASVVNSIFDTGFYAYLAAGFAMGSGGEVAVKAMQDRFLGVKSDENASPDD